MFACAESVASSCRVSFDDGAGITHTVSASSLYEAAVLAMAEFKKSGFAFGAVGSGTRPKVVVETPTSTHEPSVVRLQDWLNSNRKTPREQAMKENLRQLLARK